MESSSHRGSTHLLITVAHGKEPNEPKEELNELREEDGAPCVHDVCAHACVYRGGGREEGSGVSAGPRRVFIDFTKHKSLFP